MTLLRDIASLITKAPNTERPTMSPVLANVMGIGGGTTSGTFQHLQAYTASSTLFSIINRIGEDVASTEWTLMDNENEVDGEHPFKTLWFRPNPFMTCMEFLESSNQHMELAGEMWWILVREGGLPVEMWPVRPDRMRPVPNRDQFISGYIYQIGQERVPLEIDDVVFIKRPNPLDPYRGIGPVGSMIIDLEGEKAAAEWERQFFRNSAEPGGVIQFEEELSDSDFNRFVTRWREQHQGVRNAHRVAVLERAKWVDRKFTQREMQFDQLRRFNIDIMLLAFGVHKSIMGMSEDVNRANAEAAEVTFARRVLKPRLMRLQGAVNSQLLPMFGDNLFLDFEDPTPEDRDRNLVEATQGWQSGILRLNEARRRLGEEELSEEEGGEDFREQPSNPLPFGLSAGPVETKIEDPLLPTSIERAWLDMQQGWQRRLRAEAQAISAFIAEHMDKGWGPVTKIELSDLDGYDWDWWTKYGDEVAEELARAFSVSLIASLPDALLPRVQELAAAYAQHRAGELLRLDGTLSMVRQTRERVRGLVANTIEQGQSLRTLQRSLMDDVAFSRSRAETIARTETRTALGQGQKGAAVEQGRNEKRWITQADEVVESECRDNARQGWIKISESFVSGVDTVPQHPNCRCTVIYRTAEVHLEAGQDSKRCPTCNAGLMLNLRGEGLYCGRCKEVIPWAIKKEVRRRVERDDYGRISGVVEEQV